MNLFKTVILIFFSGILYSNSNIPDSITSHLINLDTDTSKIDYLIDQSWSFARKDPELSLALLSKLDSIISVAGEEYGKDVMYYYQGVIYKNLGKYVESERSFFNYYDYHQELNNNRHLAVVTMAMANLYSDQGLWAKSMNSVTESLQLYESQNDTLGIIRSSGKLGYLLTKLNRNEDALIYHNDAKNLAKSVENNSELSIAHSNIGNTFEELNQLDSALLHYEISQGINNKQKDEWGLVYDKTQLGKLMMKMGKEDQALLYANEGHRIAKKIKATNLIAFSQLLLGNVLINQNQFDKGIKLLDELLENDDFNNSLQDQTEAHESLYLAYKSIGQIDQAFSNLESFHTLSDSILNSSITDQVNNLEIKYQTEKKEQEIVNLQLNEELSKARISNQRIAIFSLLTGLGLLTIMLYRNRQQKLKIESQNDIIAKSLKEKDTLLREIHHRVKNNLQFVSSLLNLQSRHVEDDTALIALQEGQNRVKSMALIHQNLYQEDNLTGIEVKEYFEKLTNSLFTSYNIAPERIKLEMEIENVNLDVDSVIPIGLIVNELVSNSLKHAFPNDANGVISVRLNEENDQLILSVSDNGLGMDTSDKDGFEKSFGYKLINAFKSQLEADLDISSENGTTVEM
ncbi:MAG: histidine kinase dimerization/phosphoacceptor domain -containing protein, partial [Saprospiraceae bacterium]|nr:histidine kinase dimerization/phosphoacceptor domain -containing protein [Saprospiraceae bacterium]